MRFVGHVKSGLVDPAAEPTLAKSLGSIEQWDGHHGAGPSNASRCASRAMELAKQHGIGVVALKNTNHWMRGGTCACALLCSAVPCHVCASACASTPHSTTSTTHKFMLRPFRPGRRGIWQTGGRRATPGLE